MRALRLTHLTMFTTETCGLSSKPEQKMTEVKHTKCPCGGARRETWEGPERFCLCGWSWTQLKESDAAFSLIKNNPSWASLLFNTSGCCLPSKNSHQRPPNTHTHTQTSGRKTWNPSRIYYSDMGYILIRGRSEARGTEEEEEEEERRMLRRKMTEIQMQEEKSRLFWKHIRFALTEQKILQSTYLEQNEWMWVFSYDKLVKDPADNILIFCLFPGKLKPVYL